MPEDLADIPGGDVLDRRTQTFCAKTPDMLPVLKEAGVVDSGGQGLMVVLEGAFDAFMGKEVRIWTFEPATGESAKVVKITPQAEAGYQVWILYGIYHCIK